MVGSNQQLFPKGLYLFFTILVFGLMIWYFRKKDKKILFKLMMFTVFGLLASFAIHIFSLSSFGSGRLHVSIGMTLGYIFVIIYVLTNVLNEKRLISYFLKIILCTYVLITMFNFYILTKDHQTVNKIDKENVQKISEYIEQYEEENNVEIKYITMKYIKTTGKGHYRNINSTSSYALYGECSFDGIINFYTGRKLIRVNLTQEINQKYIEKSNGDYKALCVGNVLVCPVYNI